MTSLFRPSKTKALLSLAVALGLMRCAAAATSDPSEFLYAIRLVESGDRYDAPRGKAGEAGAYQFRYSVWRQYTAAPFSEARTAFADEIAARHYRWIARELKSGGLAPTDWNIAAAWNGGVGAVLSGRMSAATRDYATRVVNLIDREAAIRRSLTPVFRIAMAGQN